MKPSVMKLKHFDVNTKYLSFSRHQSYDFVAAAQAATDLHSGLVSSKLCRIGSQYPSWPGRCSAVSICLLPSLPIKPALYHLFIRRFYRPVNSEHPLITAHFKYCDIFLLGFSMFHWRIPAHSIQMFFGFFVRCLSIVFDVDRLNTIFNKRRPYTI